MSLTFNLTHKCLFWVSNLRLWWFYQMSLQHCNTQTCTEGHRSWYWATWIKKSQTASQVLSPSGSQKNQESVKNLGVHSHRSSQHCCHQLVSHWCWDTQLVLIQHPSSVYGWPTIKRGNSHNHIKTVGSHPSEESSVTAQWGPHIEQSCAPESSQAQEPPSVGASGRKIQRYFERETMAANIGNNRLVWLFLRAKCICTFLALPSA